MNKQTYAIINEAGRVICLAEHNAIFPTTFADGEWFDEAHQQNNGLELVLYQNVIPLRQNEVKQVLEAINRKEKLYIDFKTTLPVTVNINESGQPEHLATFYLHEPCK